MVQKGVLLKQKSGLRLGIGDRALSIIRSWWRGYRRDLLKGESVIYVKEVLISPTASKNKISKKQKKLTILYEIGNHNEICIFKYVK